MLLGRTPSGPVPGRRVVVTGVGATSCFGLGANALFDRLLDPTAPTSRRVGDFDASHLGSAKELRRLDPFALFAVAAADEAWRMSELPEHFDNGAAIIATGIGGLQTMLEQVEVMRDKGAARVSPFMVPMMMPNAGAAAVSLRYGLRGPCETITTACAAGTHAIGHAARLIASGRVDVAVGGGSEAVMVPVAEAGFFNMTALSRSGISRPFDVDRDGFVMGEGGACLILESYEHASARGATILAEVLGAASTADAHHITAPEPTGAGAIDCMRRAVEDAQIELDAVDHVNAHGTSTPLNDMAESSAVTTLFGGRAIPTTSVKGHLGHSLAAAGALEAVVSVLTLQRQVIPPTAGTATVDPAISLDIVLAPRRGDYNVVLSNSFGFGGHNGSLVFGRVN